MKAWPPALRAGRTLLLLAPATFLPILLSAPPGARADEQLKHAFSSGATAVTGGGFALGATVGESGVVGSRSGGGFSLIEGFWMPDVGIPTSVPVQDPSAGGEPIRYDNAMASIAPNPFRETTTIAFSVAAPSPVRLVIYDVTGRRVVTLVDDERAAGLHQMPWTGRDSAGRPVAAGLYFARIEIGSWTHFARMLRLR